MTQLLGCRYPIMQGAMAGYGTWKFAAVVAEARGIEDVYSVKELIITMIREAEGLLDQYPFLR